jgi:thiamine-phosphate pyrophosphorylase
MEKTIKGLYVITPVVNSAEVNSALEYPHRNLVRDVEFALLGGANIVQYRDKSRDSERRLTQAGELLTLCKRYGAIFIINDDVELAATVGAHGVHLGGDDASILAARRRLGDGAIIGASCYNRLELAVLAQQYGADYVAFGRFFPSRTKPRAVHADAQLLRQAKSQLSIPVVAIGGITAQNGAQLVCAGADVLAVVDAVFGQDDITAAARQLTQCF